jgi:hypothetical protein
MSGRIVVAKQKSTDEVKMSPTSLIRDDSDKPVDA